MSASAGVERPAAPDAAPVVVRFEHVHVTRDGQPVLEDLSFAVRAGQFVGVVGPNGAGKTTLLRALLGLVPVASGRIEVLGRPPGAARGEIGYVPQRHAIAARFPATVRDVVAMGRLGRYAGRGWPGFGRMRREDRAAAEQALARVDLLDRAERPIGRLSGGEQRRVLLAQALCASSRLLVLDEPTIGLDLPAEQAFYALLGGLDLTVIAVSHDLLALASAADELLCINRTMHVHGNPDEVVHSHALRAAYHCEFDFLAGELAHHERIAAQPSEPPDEPA
ncbi:MAG TPA: ABC transporter ATP-binding protein [Myxococcota bacterium]|nr:ABC transporter ATP-binding protein [Myxococcota bacterium]